MCIPCIVKEQLDAIDLELASARLDILRSYYAKNCYY